MVCAGPTFAAILPALERPRVSLVLTTQWQRPSLVAALRSALAQTFPSFEVVLVDDGVGARAVARAELDPLLADPRLRVVPFNQGRGCAAAKNAGLRAAEGEWVCYLDDDNVYLPDKLAAQFARATEEQARVVLCGLEFRVRGRRRVRQADRDWFRGDALLLDAIPDTNVLFHRRDNDVWWDESLRTVDDACYFQATLAKFGLTSVPNVPRALAVYHVHAGERANRGFAGFYRGQRCLLTRHAWSYSADARRVLLLRTLVAFAKFEDGRWNAFARHAVALIRAGGVGEWRYAANALAVKLPGVRRFVVT